MRNLDHLRESAHSRLLPLLKAPAVLSDGHED